MRRKNYLNEKLTKEEERYIYSAIKKAYLSSMRKYSKNKKIKIYSIDDISIQEKIPAVEDCYFEDNMNIFDSWSIILQYSKIQQDTCVQKLNELAIKFGLYKYLKTLTYNERLVFFLLEIQCFSIKKTAFLIGIDRKTVRVRYISAKNKIEEAKLKYGR